MTQSLLTTVDSNDVYLLPNGNLALGQGLAAVENGCANAAKLQLGEAVLQTGLGIPNFQAVWVGTPNIAAFQQYLRKALSNVPGVVRVVSLTTKVANNALSYVAQVESIYGNTATLSGAVPLGGSGG
jgi:hypothetical protein